MNDIQKARAGLAKWRDGDVLLWHFDEHGTVLDSTSAAVVIGATEGDARLIVGTAGNPDLLDAIERLFAEALDTEPGGRDMQAGWESGVRYAAELLAAAIIAADSRTQQ